MAEEVKNISKAEKQLVEISLGIKQPETEEEKKLKKEVNEIAKKGGIVEVPGEFF